MLILLVEDHEDTRRAMTTLLGFSGHAVTPAADGAAALATVDARAAAGDPSFDCAVVDLGLPDMTGTELMKQLVGRGLSLGVALTGSTTADDVARCRDAGFSQHIPKPVTIEQLDQALRQLKQS
ncbi:MAG: multi-sensor hybrid histidine kinase [Phycisphaerales bacterium]|nr:multi-sensor hybrid histidine kinase [Phycisphaerales bacterium]